MPASDRLEQDAVVRATADNLRIDAATAEVLRGFEAANVGCLLLKGPALGEWYTEDPARSYLDCDLWVRPRDRADAEAVLEGLGFERQMDETGLPAWWIEHGSTWFRGADGVTVDLHRTLQGIGANPEVAWEVLCAKTDFVTVGGQRTPRLTESGRTLYVTLHAAHHGTQWAKALVHLERALVVSSEEVWREAAGLARRLDAVDSFSTGLSLVPAGRVVAQRLGLPPTRSVRAALHAATPPPVALGFEQIASAGSARQRLEVILRKLFPPPGFIRHWWPPAGRNRRMLAIGYAFRPIWLLRRAPRGWLAWREARQRVRHRH